MNILIDKATPKRREWHVAPPRLHPGRLGHATEGNKYIIIVSKHHIHQNSKGELIKPQKAPTTPTKNL